MAVTLPSAGDLKTRYPEFTGVSDDLVGLVISEASHLVDESWLEADQQPAILAYTAHLLWSEGWPARVSGTFDAGLSGRAMKSRKVGDVSVEYETASSGSGGGSASLLGLNLSPYGRRFAQLMKLNAPAISLV